MRRSLIWSRAKIICSTTREWCPNGRSGGACSGGVLLAFAFWLVRTRVYRPIADLETAVAHVTGGDLSSDVRVAREDELGRLASHFNTMTNVLRERAEQHARRHENLTERFGRILDESSNEIYLFDASTLRFVQANRGVLANLGYSMEELSTLTPFDVLEDVERETLETALAALGNGEQQSVVLSCSQRRKNGSSLSHRDSVAALRGRRNARLRRRRRRHERAKPGARAQSSGSVSSR